MIKKRTGCLICDYQPVPIGGYWSFMPLVCCETRPVRRISQRRKAHK